jgi:hypothetical protein
MFGRDVEFIAGSWAADVRADEVQQHIPMAITGGDHQSWPGLGCWTIREREGDQHDFLAAEHQPATIASPSEKL